MTLQDNFAGQAIPVNHDKATESALHEKSITLDREGSYRPLQLSAISIAPNKDWLSTLCSDVVYDPRLCFAESGRRLSEYSLDDVIGLRGTPDDRRHPSGARIAAAATGLH